MTFAISEIKATDNKFVKLAKSLKLRKYRDEYKLFTIEGEKSGFEILKTKLKIISVFATEINQFIKNIEEKRIKVLKISEKLFKTISDEENPGGVLLIVEKPKYRVEDYLSNKSRFVLILNELQDPGNLGTIIRTAAAFEIDLCLLTEGTVDLYNPKVVRATSGFLFNIPVIENINIKEITQILSRLNFSIIAASSKEGENLEKANFRFPLALIIGNEGKGLNQEVLKLATYTVRIPISEKVDSLNAGVSAGILVYEIKRRLQNG